jgi:hypothetical protein
MKKIVLMVLFASSCLASEKNYAVDASMGISNAHFIYFPVPSLSFYWLKIKGDHELSGEFYTKFKEFNDLKQTEEDYMGFGVSYSFLFKLPIRNFYLGPTIGFIIYEYWKTTNEQVSNDIVVKYVDDENGLYCTGIKLAYIFGEKTIRFKIQDRLLVGLRGDRHIKGIGLFNTFNAGILIAI